MKDPQTPQPEEDEPRLLYDRKSAARMLSISVRMLDRLVANKQLDFRRIGKRVLIPRGELVKLARKNTFDISS